MRRSYPHITKHRRQKRILRYFILVPALALIAASIYLLFVQPPAIAPSIPSTLNGDTADDKQLSQLDKPSITANLQPVVDSWAAGIGGQQSVVVQDIGSGKILAAHNADKQYFAASIYKLYVAYIGYQLIDNGTYNPDELYQGGRTRAQCLDAMIRSSDSPCAEKLWNEIGKENITTRLKPYGIERTSMSGLTTTAGDSAIILKRLYDGKDLKPASRKAMLDSMLGQIYRSALPAGFTSDKVYDKVGFRGTSEYHDVAIVSFDDGSGLIVSVLTTDTGTRNIAALAKDIKRAVGR